MMGHKNTFLFALIFSLIMKEAFAGQHVVGGSQGWDASTDFDSWVSGQTFKVGDQLGRFLISHNNWFKGIINLVIKIYRTQII
jgi:hypothetical protein